MKYTVYTFSVQPKEPGNEIVTAFLSDFPFDSFDDNGDQLKAFIPSKEVVPELEAQLKESLQIDGFEISWKSEEVPEENWNAKWESSFTPVEVEDDIIIKAPFHEVEKEYPYEVLIAPKMAFGTGHHETTWLISSTMRNMKWAGKKVLDIGCGTGILAILAHKMGAPEIVAVDYDGQAVVNAEENFQLNQINSISCYEGTIVDVADSSFDIILANINRNILLHDIPYYARLLPVGGQLLLSGFYEHDVEVLEKETLKHQLTLKETCVKNTWCMMSLIKN